MVRFFYDLERMIFFFLTLTLLKGEGVGVVIVCYSSFIARRCEERSKATQSRMIKFMRLFVPQSDKLLKKPQTSTRTKLLSLLHKAYSLLHKAYCLKPKACSLLPKAYSLQPKAYRLKLTA